MTTLQNAVRYFVEKHGGIRPAARELGTDHAYLWHLLNGSKSNPDDEILSRLGLKKKVIYLRLAP